MGNDKAGAALHQMVHGFLDGDLRAGIHAGGGLVEDEDLRLGDDGAGDGEQLLLALADIAGFLVEHSVVTLRQRAHKVVHLRGLGGRQHILVRSRKAAVADIFQNGAVVQPGILQHHAEHIAQVVAGKLAHIVAVQKDSALAHVVKTHQQLDHGGFARAGGAYDGYFLAGLDDGGKVVDDGFFRCVPEMDVGKCDLTLNQVRRERLLGVGRFLRLVQKLKHALGGRGCLLQHIGDIGDLLDGLREAAHILDKRLNVAHGDGAVQRKEAAQNTDAHIAQVADKVHQRHHHAGEKLAFPGRVIQVIVDFVERLDAFFFTVEGRYHQMTAIHLLHVSVGVAQISLLLLEKGLAALDHVANDDEAQRQDAQGNQRHQRADGEHHHQNADKLRHAGDDLRHALVECLRHGVHVVGDAAEHFTVGYTVKISQRHAVDLLADIPAHSVADLGRDFCHDKALDIRQHS